MFLNNRRYERRERERTIFNIEAWTPKTELGRDVKEKRVTSIEQVFHEGRKIEEPEIIEALLPNLNSEIIEIANVQRMTKNNRKDEVQGSASMLNMVLSLSLRSYVPIVQEHH